MPTCTLVQTEKAYQVKNNNVYVLSFPEKNFEINKIELEKVLVKNELKVLKITTATPYLKIKKRGKAGKSKLEYKQRS